MSSLVRAVAQPVNLRPQLFDVNALTEQEPVQKSKCDDAHQRRERHFRWKSAALERYNRTWVQSSPPGNRHLNDRNVGETDNPEHSTVARPTDGIRAIGA